MISSNNVFESVRRGYNELEDSSQAEILTYFSNIDPDEQMGHVNNIKGILFEHEYVQKLTEDGIQAELFDLTNHPVTDLMLIENDVIIDELQLKATDSVSYINSTLSEHPDIDIVVTSEVAGLMDSESIIDSGISNSALEESVSEILFDEVINPVSPLSGIGWLLGLPF